MKVIFATDFYASSTTARALLTRLEWPTAARLEMLHVLTPPRPSSLFAASRGHDPAILEAAVSELRSFAGDLAARVDGSRGSVQYTIRVGDPASSILKRAAATAADLLVIGGPGRAESVSGEMSPLSAAVVEGAPCSVLVARTESVDNLVLADPSTAAVQSAAWVSRWPLFRSIPLTAVAVEDDFGQNDLVVINTDVGRDGTIGGELARAFTGWSLMIARRTRSPYDRQRSASERHGFASCTGPGRQLLRR